MTATIKKSTPHQPPPVKVDIFYALITLGSSTVWTFLDSWLLYFYLPPEGAPLVPAALYGLATFITRVVNALITPPIGHLSDQTRSRWGRRLPFMFASALPLLIFYTLLWIPPKSHQSTWNLLYLMLILGLYNVAYVFNQVPYMALLPEIASTDHHRVRTSAWTSSFMLLGVILGGLAGPAISTLGYPKAALLYAGALLPVFYLPFLVLRERPDHRSVATRRLDFRHSIALMFRNRAFLIMTATGVFYWGMATLIVAVTPYIVTEICLLDQGSAWIFYIPAVMASLLCYPVITRLSNRLGKWKVFTGSLLASAIVMPSLMLIGDWFPIALKIQGLIWITLQAMAMSGVVMLPPAFGAEIVDHDAELTGQRREGTYYAFWGFLDQVINGLVSLMLPLLLLLGRSRSDPHGPLGVRMVGVIGGVMLFVAFLIFLRYPLRKRSFPQGGPG